MKGFRGLMLNDKIIAIIGTGNMGDALVSGVDKFRFIQTEKILSARMSERIDSIILNPGTKSVPPPAISRPSPKRILLSIAVKPQLMAAVLTETGAKLDMSKLVISIAAGSASGGNGILYRQGYAPDSSDAEYCCCRKRGCLRHCSR